DRMLMMVKDYRRCTCWPPKWTAGGQCNGVPSAENQVQFGDWLSSFCSTFQIAGGPNGVGRCFGYKERRTPGQPGHQTLAGENEDTARREVMQSARRGEKLTSRIGHQGR